MKPYRNSRGQFARFPVGTIILLLDKKTSRMDEVYYVVIAAKGNHIATIPYTHAPTHLHPHNFKVKDLNKLEVVKHLNSDEIGELISKIKTVITEMEPFDAYINVARHAIAQLELISK